MEFLLRFAARFHKTVPFLAVTLIASAPAWAASPSFTVNMSEAVTVTGTPRIAVDVGGVTRYATYASGSGTSSLTFTYSPQEGDLDLDGISLSSPVDLNGGTITDLNGNPETNLTFTVPDTSGVKIDYPSLSMDFISDDYILSGTHYNSLSSFLSAAGGSFTRNSVGTYFDSTGTMQTASANIPRFDHDPVTHAAKGILIEEQRTNGIKNNTMVGALAGTPGTLPTYWNRTGNNSVSVDITGVGVESGISYIDVRFYGTTSTAGPRGIMFNSGTTCTAVPSGNNAISAYLKVQSGSLTNVHYWGLIAGGLASGGTSTGEYKSSHPYIQGGALSQQRYVSNLSFTNASTVAISPYLEFYPTGAGVPIDVTIRIGTPQCEQGNFATSVIPTTNGAVTRQADVLTIPTGAWYDASQGAMYAQADINKLGGQTYPGTASIDDGSISNAVHMLVNDFSGDAISASVWNSGASQASYVGSVCTAETVFVQGVSYKDNDFIGADNGNLGSVDTSVSIPALSVLRIGESRGGHNYLNGHILKYKYYPFRISNTQLQLLTQ